jgi:hypothetical protein
MADTFCRPNAEELQAENGSFLKTAQYAGNDQNCARLSGVLFEKLESAWDPQ